MRSLFGGSWNLLLTLQHRYPATLITNPGVYDARFLMSPRVRRAARNETIDRKSWQYFDKRACIAPWEL